MGSHRTPPDGLGIHRLPSPPLQSPHRGQVHPTQVHHALTTNFWTSGYAALPPLKSVGRQLHSAHSPNYTVAIFSGCGPRIRKNHRRYNLPKPIRVVLS